MAWTTPTTRSTDDLINASIWNTDLVDNLAWLKDPLTDVVSLAAQLTTTSTSFADMTGVTRTVTTNGGSVLVGFTCAIGIAAAAVINFDLQVDGTSQGGTDGIVSHFHTGTGSIALPVSFVWLVEGLSAASHTFKLRWKTSAGTVTLYAENSSATFKVEPQFWVRES